MAVPPSRSNSSVVTWMTDINLTQEEAKIKEILESHFEMLLNPATQEEEIQTVQKYLDEALSSGKEEQIVPLDQAIDFNDIKHRVAVLYWAHKKEKEKAFLEPEDSGFVFLECTEKLSEEIAKDEAMLSEISIQMNDMLTSSLASQNFVGLQEGLEQCSQLIANYKDKYSLAKMTNTASLSEDQQAIQKAIQTHFGKLISIEEVEQLEKDLNEAMEDPEGIRPFPKEPNFNDSKDKIAVLYRTLIHLEEEPWSEQHHLIQGILQQRFPNAPLLSLEEIREVEKRYQDILESDEDFSLKGAEEILDFESLDDRVAAYYQFCESTKLSKNEASN